jgi:hypothetical protein
MLGNVRVLLLPVFFIAPRRNLLWVLREPPRCDLFSHGFGFEVSGIVYRSVFHMIYGSGYSSSRSARAHEPIVKRYGRSVRIQGSGPVSVACILRVA